VTFNWTDNPGGSGVNPDACNLTTVVTAQGSNVGYGGGCSDLAGNVGEYVDFLLIDKDAPETSITANPPATSTSADAAFELSGTDAVADDNALDFECQLDGSGFTLCGSSQSYTGLSNGSHTFGVRASDTAGLVDPTAASYTWTVDVADPNEPPVVSAGDDQTIMLPIVANLAGTVTDDGNPGPVSVLWTQESGPGTVTFGDAASATTTAGFSAAGTYVLRLTADDGQVSAFDELTVTVNEEPAGELFATCGGYDVFEIGPGVYEAPDFNGNLIIGTNAGELIQGTNGRDLILGLGGPDEIYARRGNDIICAGRGNDYVEGGRGNDLIIGGTGGDWLIGSNGNDEIWGGRGHDYLEGSRGRDTIYGEEGFDVLRGGQQNDSLFGGNGGDTLNGRNGNDSCNGGNGNDSLAACES
ncbi:MAG: hypothetical protein AB8G95_30980, partial [Anaerolineae bacterium]